MKVVQALKIIIFIIFIDSGHYYSYIFDYD